MSNKGTYFLLFLVVIAIAIPVYIRYSFRNFVDDKPQAYLDYVSNRINFGTVTANSIEEWDTIQTRINQFFANHESYNVPDNIDLIESECINCAQIEKLVYFQGTPKEIYRVTFDMTSYNYIDEIYKITSGDLLELKTTTLDSTEKVRVKDRLKKEVLEKIDWTLNGIKK